MLNGAQTTTTNGSNPLATALRVLVKVGISGLYCTTGLGLIAGGAFGVVYSAQKIHQFYLDPQAQPINPNLPLPTYGFGPMFNKACLYLSEQGGLASGAETCADLSTKCWKQLTSAESTASAVGVTIIATGGVLYGSSALMMTGLSLFVRGWSLLTEALLGTI